MNLGFIVQNPLDLFTAKINENSKLKTFGRLTCTTQMEKLSFCSDSTYGVIGCLNGFLFWLILLHEPIIYVNLNFILYLYIY